MSTRSSPPRRPRCRRGATPARTPVPAVCVEILTRLHENIFELANAVQFTTGQAFVMAFQAGGPHALDRALEAITYAHAEMTRHPAHGTVGEAGRQGRSAADEQDVPRRAARHRARDRLQHVPDLELLPGPVRLAGHRQRRDRQAAPGRRAAARDHREVRPRGARRGRLRPEPGAARAGGRRREDRLDAGGAPGGQDRRLHRLDRVRRLARRATPARPRSTPRRPASTRS